jgi:hypothetical protein
LNTNATTLNRSEEYNVADAGGKLVRLATCFDLTEAYLLKGLLESEGLEVFLFDEHAAAYTPFVIGGVRLMVKEAELERARGVLSTGEQ